MQKKVIKCIVVPRGVVAEIMALERCSKVAVYRALRLECQSEQADRIRQAAKERGGVVTTKVVFSRTVEV